MPKRKRGCDEPYLEEAVAEQRARVQKQIFQGKRELQRALKLAKGFERAKLQRRLKQAQSNNDEAETSRISAEISAWKTIGTASCAETHLYKALLKSKAIAQHPALPGEVQVERHELDTPTANVTARLYNAACTKKAMEHALSSIRTIMRVTDVAQKAQKRLGKPSELVDQQEKPAGESEGEFAGFSSGNGSVADYRREHIHQLKDLDDHLSDEQGGAFDAIDDRVATSSDDDKDASDAPSDSSFPIRRGRGTPISPSPPPGKGARKREYQLGTETTIPHFVPTLQVGYISGSESSATDVDADMAPRKNRRGQRARQAIWEKKYGAGAKHLKQPNKGTRDSGWDLKRGAMAEGDRPHWKRTMQRSGPPGVDGVNAAPVRQPRVLGKDLEMKGKGKVVGMNDGPLHPSWVAKQKAKEKQMHIPEYQGKRITFD